MVSEATGSVLWTADVGSAVTADPGIAGDAVLVPTAADGLVALPLAGCGAPSCAPTWAFDVPMAIGSGHLLVTVGSVMHAFPAESE